MNLTYILQLTYLIINTYLSRYSGNFQISNNNSKNGLFIHVASAYKYTNKLIFNNNLN